MGRLLENHRVEGADEWLTIEVADEPGAGGACHEYYISWPTPTHRDPGLRTFQAVTFQNGPIREAGVNGVTQEALLAIVIDRLESFQAGPFPSDQNAVALDHVKAALWHLKERTRMRLARGVEGTTQA